jgi:hypothetical protein
MDVGAYLLPRLGRSKGSNNGYRRGILALGRCWTATKNGIKLRRYGLIVVDAVQAESKRLH